MPAARVKFVRASASALASRQVQFETSSKDASDLPGKPSLHRSSKGIPFCVAGAQAQPLWGIQDIPKEQCSHLFTRDPLAASYFNEEQYMFYYPTGAVEVRDVMGTGRIIKQALRDHCADVNLIPANLVRWAGWRIIPPPYPRVRIWIGKSLEPWIRRGCTSTSYQAWHMRFAYGSPRRW